METRDLVYDFIFRKTVFQSKADNLQTGHTDTIFLPVTLILS